MQLGILGGGSWGTALALLWAANGHRVKLWVRDPEQALRFREERRNTKYLPDFPFPDDLQVTTLLEETVESCSVLCLAVPLQAYRPFLKKLQVSLREDHRLVLLSKGIELGTQRLPHQIVHEVLGPRWGNRQFTLSGPSFAREVAAGLPTTVVLAGNQVERLKVLQTELNCPSFRMYRNVDVLGVELCGALKNVIAIASGIVEGLGLGRNTMAGLITRGLAEITRLGERLGARRETFSGLAGMGDLILTCTGSLSRNLTVGLGLGRGRSLDAVLANLGMVAEGVHTARSAYELALGVGIEMPISNVVYRILYEGLSPSQALKNLMSRSLKEESAPRGSYSKKD